MKSQPVQRAIISVSDKAGIVEFAAALSRLGVDILSTGGTARLLRSAELTVIGIDEITQYPEMLDGRVKTLHPAVHGGILFRRDRQDHTAAIKAAGIAPIDLVCVNLYPFSDTVSRGSNVEECVENIDIGGPAMIRAAAKNYQDVVVLVEPSDYAAVLCELQETGGTVSLPTRKRLAARAFAHVAAYDAVIASWMHERLAEETEPPERITISGRLRYRCRYGENPHQAAAVYEQPNSQEPGVGTGTLLSGRELSYNNLCDAEAALELVKDLDERPACAIVKHANPCGAAMAGTLAEAFGGALEGDRVSAFGGIVAFNREVDPEAAAALTAQGLFFEVVVAPGFAPDALATIIGRKGWGANVRLLAVGELDGWRQKADRWSVRQINGALLVQERDIKLINQDDMRVVTDRAPTAEEMAELLFAWRVVKHVKSNAIVLTRDHQVVGVGAGQMNRVQSVRLAVSQAGKAAAGAVLASDAFFPFDDGPALAADSGVTAIIQPGGSKKDADTIALCNARGIAMIFTGVRHFRH